MAPVNDFARRPGGLSAAAPGGAGLLIGRLVVAAPVAVAMGVAMPSSAWAQSCVRIGGLYRSAGCSVEGERAREAAREAEDARLQRPFLDFDRRVPRLPSPRVPGKEGPTTLADLRLVGDGMGGFRGSRPGYRFRIARDGGITFDDGGGAPGLLALGALGVFDLTDLVIRLQGGDPYSYDKGLVIELTRPLRAEMTDTDRRSRLERAVAHLPAELSWIWRQGAPDPAARRELLFRLWDELVEDQLNDDDLAIAAARARATILRFIQTAAPAGSAAAYSPEELRRLNAQRRSRQRFEPYPARP